MDEPKPVLLHKLEGSTNEIHAAIIIPGENGVISVSADRSVRVWQLRDSGQYWPSICHYMGAAATALHYTHETRNLFVGLDTGSIEEFTLSPDYNRMESVRVYNAHQNARVCRILVDRENSWLLSGGRDKYFHFHCTVTGKRLGGYQCNAWCTSLAYDTDAKYAFVGDYSGSITVCKLETSGVKFITSLKGQAGSIRCLAWDGTKNWLYSGSFDSTVFVWDIAKINLINQINIKFCSNYFSEMFLPFFRLLSSGEDGKLVCWDMSLQRLETPDWAESDNCQLCNRPFFWNMKSMYEQKQIGLRQHHCRRCGKAICDNCSSKRSILPARGHEYPVRVCENCYINVQPVEKKSMANFYETRGMVSWMDYDEERKLLLTVSRDNIMKIWNIENILQVAVYTGP
ncbi:WD repeat and FYVE domain-containing protein 2 [Eurytemora carolleeae]|uniref:WD repeat and FYVE domain-containing protein 2 n=1 Tax=Eurytemora carolleeae TaxID=1294199 RepID=UPI000C78D4F5|nr:WD repeat and FYVE domain-containing protein 2 [Eurytemora carolleeae]|eukprot:XP_023335194.1 WD repeat and FYVE domain-containing protein 2-like [Eurytemora affinis]